MNKYYQTSEFKFIYKFWDTIYVISGIGKLEQFSEQQLAEILQVTRETIEDIISNYQIEYVKINKYKFQFGFKYEQDAHKVTQWLNDCLLIQKMI